MGYDSEWGGEEKPGQGIMVEKMDQPVTSVGYENEILSSSATRVLPSDLAVIASEATRRPLRTAERSCAFDLIGNNIDLGNRCSYVTFVPLI